MYNYNKDAEKDVLYSELFPSISVYDYMLRIAVTYETEISTLISAFILIDRMQNMNEYVINYHNIYKIFAAMTCISLKMNEDIIFPNVILAKESGFDLLDFNNLELRCFYLMDHNVFIEEAVFDYYRNTFLEID